jgi:glycerate 2-kinase
MTNRPRLRIAVAPGPFKGSLTAEQAAACIARGLRKGLPRVSTVLVPMADGGDGTLDAVVKGTGGHRVICRASDPLQRRIRAAFGVTGDGRTAIVEMAAASGLVLLQPRERDPLRTTTRGTGELICRALDLGVSRILVGIGGSATNDGGAGMARALGVRFLDRQGRDLPEGGGALEGLWRIDASGLDPRLSGVGVDVACDVVNPLVGPRGAARVYGPQKGATPQMVAHLDRGLRRLAIVIRRDLGHSVRDVPGAGAAGGLGAGLMAFLGARLRRGVDIVMEAVGLERKLRGCDLVITGEGRLDGQTAYGKAPAGVARLASRMGVPVVVIGGCIGPDARRVLSAGVDAYFSALQEPVEESQLAARGPGMLTDCAEQIGRLLRLGWEKPRGWRAGKCPTTCAGSGSRLRRAPV